MWGYDMMFNFSSAFISIVFIFVFGIIIFTVFNGVKQWHKNENSPRLSVPAFVKTKRTHISRHSHHHGDNMHGHSTSTRYYVTFEFESGDRSEFSISGNEYGILAEGDFGILTFQGTRYLGFERKVV